MGYNTCSVNPGETKLLAVSFEGVDTKPIPIKKLVSCENFAGSTAIKDTVDQIWTYTQAGGWAKYYYYKRSSTTKWCPAGSTTEVGDDVTVGPGTSIFFVRASGEAATTITLAGGVVDLSTVKTVDVAAGETKLICNPWPLDIKINPTFQEKRENSGIAGVFSLFG